MAEKKDKKKIYKPKPISGFPEWLPEYRAVELQWLDKIRAVFESYGYCSIETPAVEELEVIAAKGEDVDKEIYVLERLQADEDSKKDARLALHFDQTVPLARYVAQHFDALTFPFKRYQMQKVWRGERPQMGRMREFLQCDIDVINVDHLPIHFDAEVASICYEALASLDIGRVQLRVSNRKILSSLIEAHLREDKIRENLIFRLLDKREKLSPDDFQKELKNLFDNQFSDTEKLYDDIRAFIGYADKLNTLDKSKQITFLEDMCAASSSADKWPIFHEKYKLASVKLFDHGFIKGFDEILFVLKHLQSLPEDAVVADLSIVRGLDYYTGTVYETQLLDVPEFTGSVCSGGRYDDLAGSYINKHLPGVGISIGFSRLFDVLRQNGKIEAGPSSPAKVLVVLPEEEQRGVMNEVAQTLRKRGINTETAHGGKLKKQIAYAEKKGIPYVWFPADGQVKDMANGEQTDADAESWTV